MLSEMDVEQFKGLVLSYDEGITAELYSDFAADTQIQPCYIEGNTKYYPDLQGKYRLVAERSGYITLNKNIYIAAQTRVEEHVSLVKHDGAWDPESVRRLTDQALAAFPADRSQWPQYAPVFTTPVFAEGRQAHKFTTQTEMEDFIAGLDRADDKMYVYSMGTTPTSPAFNMPLVIFTETDLSGAKTLEEAAALLRSNGKPTVHYEGQIHGIEYAAGEAALGMIALLNTAYGDALLDKMNIYVIPRLNPDGAYRFQRRIPNEDVDPNRDFLNIKTYEIQRQHYVYNLFAPVLVIDGHEYTVRLENTGMNCKDIMINASRASLATEELATQSDEMARALFANMKANHLSYGLYNNTVSGANSNIGTTYTAYRGSLFFLLESHGIHGGTYNMARRVVSHVSAVDGMLRYLHENTQVVVDAVRKQRQKLIEDGKTYGTGDKIPLKTVTREVPEMVIPDGKYVDLATGELTDVVFPAQTYDVITRDREAPTAYLVPKDHEKIDYILWHTNLHGIVHYEIPAGSAVMVQHVGGSTAEAVIYEERKTVFPKGAYVFGMDQAPARILSMLMEPDVDDVSGHNGTYAQAGVFVLENGEYPVYRYVRDLNRESKIDYERIS